MVIDLLADVNIEGHVDRLVAWMQGPYWQDIWHHLEVRALKFGDVGLHPDDTDLRVWQLCQDKQLLLLTNNRNDDGPESLQATIRRHATSISLPIFTVSNADQILDSRDYRDRVAETLFDYLLRIETLRGTGRIFLP